MSGPLALGLVPFGTLLDQVCAELKVEPWSVPGTTLTPCFKNYVRLAADVKVRAQGDGYNSVLRVKPARACGCDGRGCEHRTVRFSASEYVALQAALGPLAVPKPRGARPFENIWADPCSRATSATGYEDHIVAPVLVPPQHQALARRLLHAAVSAFAAQRRP